MVKVRSPDVGESIAWQPHTEFKLDRWPFYWIIRANGVYIERLERKLKENGFDIPNWRVLSLLGEGRSRSISYLANENVSKPSTMTKIVQRMIRDGLVIVRHGEADARVVEALLTPEGERARLLAIEHATRLIAEAVDSIDEHDLQIMMRTLRKVIENLGRATLPADA